VSRPRILRFTGVALSRTGGATAERVQSWLAPARGRAARLPARYRYDFAGLAGAVVLFCLSLTPSLLPRGWLFQAVAGGIVAAIGYGLGALVGWLVRRLTGWQPPARARRVAWRVLGAAAAVLLVVFLRLGSQWQRRIHSLMGEPGPDPYHWVRILVGALLLFVALVGLARLLRRFARFLGRVLGRWIPLPVARLAGAAVAVLLVLGLGNGIVYRGGIDGVGSAFKTINRETTPGVAAPSSPDRSGGPGSLASWSSLGRKGRDFVAGAPTVAQLEAFSGRPAREPIRVYAGLESASGLQRQAALVVAELQRTGAFSRRVLCVVTTTGTGWVDRRAIDPLEYMYGGDTAVAAMQYSYLPSWLSFLTDRSDATAAGRELFDQVYARWSRLPARHRPWLLVFGESLGAFGGEAAFSGTDDLRNRTDGVLWVGPPNSDALWRDFTDHRDPGTPEVLPTYQHGRTVRFAARPADLDRPAAPWPFPRVVYLQHASDPIVWWSPALLLREPRWLRQPRGPDVLPDMHWYPLVTFWQVTADMAYATAVPAGHGHNYGAEQVNAWARIAPPGGWTATQTARLRGVIGDQAPAGR
jgi:uncharacterized membrane protein